MTTRPDVKTQSTTDKTIKRLLLKHSLVRIEFKVTERTTFAQAFPQSYHQAVATRRQERLESAAAAAGGSIALAEAQEITNSALDAIAEGYGDSLDDALWDVERALKAL